MCNVIGDNVDSYAESFPINAVEYLSNARKSEEIIKTAYVAHFQFKSEEDFMRRVMRGGFDAQQMYKEKYESGSYIDILDSLNEVEDLYLKKYCDNYVGSAIHYTDTNDGVGVVMPKHNVWVRHIMDLATRKMVEIRNPETLDVCEVSGKSWEDMFKWKSYTHKSYPEFDICSSSFDQEFDLIIAEQVFEHVRHPARAAENMFRGLRSGGYALITVPFMYHIHPTPLDCWRWTPQGLKFLLEDAGFPEANIETDGWGNYEVFLHHAMVGDAPVFNGQQPLHNIPHIPVMVWGIAKK